MAPEAAVPPHAPLDPHERNAHEEERDEVRDHERAAAVLDRLPGEAKEVAEADGVAGHGEDQPDARAPLLAVNDFISHKGSGKRGGR